MNRLALIHQIQTDNSLYQVFTVETDLTHFVPIEIDQHINTEGGAAVCHDVLKKELAEHALSLNDTVPYAYERFIDATIALLRKRIIANGETIISDEICYRKLIGGFVYEDQIEKK